MKKYLILLAAVAMLLASCSGKKEISKPDEESREEVKPKWTLGMSQCNLGEPWRVQMNQDIRNAAENHPEIKVIFKDAQNDSLTQRSQIEEFINADVDLLIVSPKEAAPMTPPISAAYDKGIPVIILDRRILGEKTPGQDRYSGFREGIQGSDIDIIFEADMKWLEPEARKEMESALARFDKIDLVYAHNDPGAHGAYLAAEAAGREKDIVFIGIDALPHEGQIYVKQGILAASFEYPTGGKEAIETALAILQGRPAKKEITLSSRIFTTENIDSGGEYIERFSK